MRHPKFSVQTIENALVAHKGLLSLTAKSLGCDRNTIYRAVKKHARLQKVIDEQREHVVDTAELALMASIQDQQGWAVCFVLKTLGRNRGYVERQEITGKDGGSVDVNISGQLNKIYGDDGETGQ